MEGKIVGFAHIQGFSDTVYGAKGAGIAKGMIDEKTYFDLIKNNVGFVNLPGNPGGESKGTSPPLDDK